MNLTEFHTQLRIDLKDAAVVWSNTELTRCIERAVDDLSRHLPRERIYEVTYKNVVIDDSFATAAALDVDKIVVNEDISGPWVDGAACTLAVHWLDVPRPITITLTDAGDGITSFTIIVKGTDADGIYHEERFYRYDGKAQTGKINFFAISEVEIDELTGEGALDLLNVGIGAFTDVWVQLDNPIEPGSESIYSGALKTGTKYTRDTDYYMDYANGRIKIISTGSMAAGTTYYANYNKSALSIDVSSILPELSRIAKVIYPADKIPEQSVAHTIWENMMTIGSLRPGVSQEALTDGGHIAIYYETRHTPPTTVGRGSYPEYLDQIVSIGAAAYALFIEALQYEQQAVSDLILLRTALNTVTDYINEAHTIIGKMDTYLVDTAGAGTDNARDVLANITDDIEVLRDAIHKAGTPDTGALFKMLTYLDDVDVVDLGKATTGAEAMLDAGDGLIDQLNDGKNVPEIYADYARARAQVGQIRTQAALGYVQEAALRLSNIRSHIEEAAGWVNIANGFATDAAHRISMGQTIIGQTAQYQETAAADMILADRFRAEAQIRYADFQERLKAKAEYRRRVVSVPPTQPK